MQKFKLLVEAEETALFRLDEEGGLPIEEHFTDRMVEVEYQEEIANVPIVGEDEYHLLTFDIGVEGK